MKKLLYAGIVGPLLFIAVFLIEGATRPGYSAWRHYVSQLATGDGGWMQVVNFLVCGTLVLLFAMGLRSALRRSRGSIGAPLLLGLFAVALLVAGTFSTDPAPAAAFVMAWHFGGEPSSRRWVIYSLTVGVVIVAMFIASTAVSTMDELGAWPNAPTGFLQRIAIITGWTWIAMVAWREIRRV